jgi:hypothetical protein
MNEIAAQFPDREHSSIWQELDEWARDFKPWQRYIVAHCVREGLLSETRINEAYALFLFEHKIGEAPDHSIEIPATITGRPTSSVSTAICITRVGNLAGINALPSDAELTFSPGLTIVYGANGVGKSGFARILSNVCFSRAKHKILPNINQEELQTGPAADIVIRAENIESTLRLDAKTEHADLKRFAVFDTAVARVHLVEQNPLGFKPTGFDIFPEMARCYGLVNIPRQSRGL